MLAGCCGDLENVGLVRRDDDVIAPPGRALDDSHVDYILMTGSAGQFADTTRWFGGHRFGLTACPHPRAVAGPFGGRSSVSSVACGPPGNSARVGELLATSTGRSPESMSAKSMIKEMSMSPRTGECGSQSRGLRF